MDTYLETAFATEGGSVPTGHQLVASTFVFAVSQSQRARAAIDLFGWATLTQIDQFLWLNVKPFCTGRTMKCEERKISAYVSDIYHF